MGVKELPTEPPIVPLMPEIDLISVIYKLLVHKNSIFSVQYSMLISLLKNLFNTVRKT